MLFFTLLMPSRGMNPVSVPICICGLVSLKRTSVMDYYGARIFVFWIFYFYKEQEKNGTGLCPCNKIIVHNKVLQTQRYVKERLKSPSFVEQRAFYRVSDDLRVK